MTRSNREFTETIQTAQDWASSRIDEIIEKMRKVPYVEMQLIWKESWGTGYAAELLAPHWKIDSSKALHIGLLADIGMLILSQLVNF